MFQLSRFAGVSFAGFMFAGNASATIVNVPADQPTIQAGIDAAVNGDTVWVASGTYNEAINFNGKSIIVESQDGPKATIIDATGLNTSVVKFISGEGNASVLRGFRITGGDGTVVGSSRVGGGIYATGSPTVEQCEIIDNSVFSPTSPGAGVGGGIYVNGSMILRDCLIADNSASGSPNGLGGGMRGIGSPIVIRCTFTGNSAGGSLAGTGGGQGGGVNSTNGIFINCVFQSNGVTGPGPSGGGAYGGQLYVNCTFVENLTSACCVGALAGSGAGIVASSSTTLINCTVAFNNDQNGQGPPPTTGVAPMGLSNAPTLKNCIVFSNDGNQVVGTANVSHSLVQGGFAGQGNIDGDPMFVDSANDDYGLGTGSPCIDVGNVDSLPLDTYDLDADGNTKERLPLDLAANRRIVNGFLDMGAFEWQRSCLADISPSSPGVAGDGAIDVDDLLAVINGWGECDGCVADVNGDNSVDVDDLLEVINGWGECD